MKYALVVENNPVSCNSTSSILTSLGYLVTPTFNLRKALHAVQMIQFDLIVTWTVENADDRRALPGELKRHSRDAVLIWVRDPGSGTTASGKFDGVDAIVHRPFTAQDMRHVIASCTDGVAVPPMPLRQQEERRGRASG